MRVNDYLHEKKIQSVHQRQHPFIICALPVVVSKHSFLDHNLLSGTIPASFGSLGSVDHLNFYENRLTGSLPAVGQCTVSFVALFRQCLQKIMFKMECILPVAVTYAHLSS